MLANLAVNARDAMSGGGTLSIHTANITAGSGAGHGDLNSGSTVKKGSTVGAGRYVQLRVSDTGTGMPADVAEHAFEPFFTTKSAGAGSGLGLATVFGIVAQADGSITVETEPGVGTTFTIVIPATDEVAVPIPEPTTFHRIPKGEMVVVVEDDDALRAVTERIFIAAGYKVLTASSGPEAVAAATGYDGEIHLVLTDVVMPTMLGKEVADKIRGVKPDIQVLYMSGYAQPVLASQGRLDPSANLIEKPFSAAELIDKAGQVLNGHFPGYTTVATDTATPPADTDPPPPDD